MADLDKLKTTRSRAQAAFTKRANLLLKPGLLEPSEVSRDWRLFKAEFSRVVDVGYDYVEALREAKDDDAAKEIEKKTEECENRYLEVKRATQEAFWAIHAEETFFKQVKDSDSAIKLAEEEETVSPPNR